MFLVWADCDKTVENSDVRDMGRYIEHRHFGIPQTISRSWLGVPILSMVGQCLNAGTCCFKGVSSQTGLITSHPLSPATTRSEFSSINRDYIE